MCAALYNKCELWAYVCGGIVCVCVHVCVCTYVTNGNWWQAMPLAPSTGLFFTVCADGQGDDPHFAEYTRSMACHICLQDGNARAAATQQDPGVQDDFDCIICSAAPQECVYKVRVLLLSFIVHHDTQKVCHCVLSFASCMSLHVVII